MSTVEEILEHPPHGDLFVVVEGRTPGPLCEQAIAAMTKLARRWRRGPGTGYLWGTRFRVTIELVSEARDTVVVEP